MLSKASEMNSLLKQTDNVFSPVVIIKESQMTTIKFLDRKHLYLAYAFDKFYFFIWAFLFFLTAS